jgi:hypothetical protein
LTTTTATLSTPSRRQRRNESTSIGDHWQVITDTQSGLCTPHAASAAFTLSVYAHRQDDALKAAERSFERPLLATNS